MPVTLRDKIDGTLPIVLKMGVALFSNKVSSVVELGDILIENVTDDLCDGIWIWQIDNDQVYYSPKFCNVLGYEHGELGDGFRGFDRGNDAQWSYVMNLINKLIEDQSHSVSEFKIDYLKKDNTVVSLICSGTVFYKNNAPFYIIGLNEIIKEK